MARTAIRDYLAQRGDKLRLASLLLVGVGACIMIFCLCLGGRWPNLTSDQGPFHGSPSTFEPTLPAYDTIAVGRGMVLQAWDAPTTSTSAIVRMSTTGGRALWTIEAEGTRRVSFGSVSYRLGGYTVTGFVEDSSRATWYIGWWGGLSGYYHSS